jgi:hypothetical protein
MSSIGSSNKNYHWLLCSCISERYNGTYKVELSDWRIEFKIQPSPSTHFQDMELLLDIEFRLCSACRGAASLQHIHVSHSWFGNMEHLFHSWADNRGALLSFHLFNLFCASSTCIRGEIRNEFISIHVEMDKRQAWKTGWIVISYKIVLSICNGFQ